MQKSETFWKKNPNWPGKNNLITRAEEKMNSDISPDKALRWFELFKPISTAGRIKHAIALLASGAKVKAKNLIRHTWIQDNFPKDSEKAFYRRFRVFLTKSDHIERLDRLLWDGKYWASKRMIYKVPESWRKLAIARYSLRKRTGNVDTLIKNVPTSLKKNPGLAYERLRWRRQKKLNSASDILKNMPEKSIRPRLWWRERAILARRTLRKGFINEALTFVSEHDLIRGVEFANAEWMAGWIRLRFLGDSKAAMRHFKKMFLSVRYPISKARGAYWVARAAENMGKIEISKYWYKRAAIYKTSFYGQLAAEKFSSTNVLSFKQVPKPPRSVENKFNSQELVRVVSMLHRLRHNDLIYPFINQLYSFSKSLEEKAREVLKGNLSQIETQLRDAATRNFSLEDNLTMVENDLQKALSDRNQALFESTGLRQKINVLENKITNLQSVQEDSIQNINNLLDDSISLFTGIIDSTGIKLSRLMGKQKVVKKVGVGGPFIPAQSDLSSGEKMRQDLILLNDKIRMWDNLKGFLKQLPLISPVNSHYISSGFGKRRDPFNKRWAAHYGIDLVSHFKAPVYSTAAGKVSYVGRKGRYGRLIEIKHGAGFKTRYGHLHKIYVKRGENIRPYQKIGLLGNSGRSTGPHLHYEVIFKGKPMNPRNFIKAGYYVFKNKW